MSEFGNPCGYCFDPTDELLVLFYLTRKLNGDPIPPCPIQEFDIYGDKDPWELFDKNSVDCAYVFTKLKKKQKSNVRISRTAGSGTWKGRNTKEEKGEEGKVLWFKREFVFEVNDKKSSTCNNGHWIMYEFSLQEELANNYVICKIWNKEARDLHREKRKQSKRKFSVEGGEEVRRPNKMQITLDSVEAMPVSPLFAEHQHDLVPQVSAQFENGYEFEIPITGTSKEVASSNSSLAIPEFGDFLSYTSLLTEDFEFTEDLDSLLASI